MFGQGINFNDKNLYHNANSLAQSVTYSALQTNFSGINAAKSTTEEIKVRSTEKSNYTNNVYFREGLRGESVNVGLSSENLQRLQAVFGNTGTKRDDKGNVILSGKAEEFVSSWFNDIAYRRGFIKADSNNDGTLSTEEKLEVFAFFCGWNQSDFVNYKKVTDPLFSNAGDIRGVRIVADSIEEELNRTLEFDKDMNGKIHFRDIASTEQIVDYLLEMVNRDKGYIPPSFADAFGFLTQTMKDLKKMLEKELKKVGIDSSTIDLTASAEEVFKQIMENEKGVEVLENIQKKLENQNKQENQENQEINSEDSTFKEIAKLTKLDRETLAYNLQNNPNFEGDIISIVQENSHKM